MWLLFDLLLDRVSDVVVDLAAIPEVLLDFGCITHVFLFAIVAIFAVVSFVVDAVAKGIDLALAIFVLILIVSFLALLLLKHNFGAKLLQEFVCRLQDLHKARVPLCIDQIDICVKIVVFERVQPFDLLLVFLTLLFLLLLRQVALGEARISLDLADALFVKLDKFFLTIEHFF